MLEYDWLVMKDMMKGECWLVSLNSRDLEWYNIVRGEFHTSCEQEKIK